MATAVSLPATRGVPLVRLAPAPRVAPALIGRTQPEARALLGTVFTLCGHAHVDAAERAFAVAGGAPLTAQARIARARATRTEAIREHGLRILLDWPLLLGEAPDTAAGARWMRLCATLADRDGAKDAMAEVTLFLERTLFGMPPAVWLDAADDTDWATRGATVAARLLRHIGLLARKAPLAIDGCDVSVLARRAGHPRLQGAAPLEALYLARLIDLVMCLDHHDDGGDDRVWTARGRLDHRCRLTGNRIADYAIVSPTDVHFGADGAATRALAEICHAPPSLHLPLVKAVVRAFDPCVPFTIEAG